MSKTIDEVFDRMLVIPNTGGEIYNHSAGEIREAKAALSAMVEEIIKQPDNLSRCLDCTEAYSYEQILRQRAIERGFIINGV